MGRPTVISTPGHQPMPSAFCPSDTADVEVEAGRQRVNFLVSCCRYRKSGQCQLEVIGMQPLPV
jgi:hypothetical protein